MRSFEYKSEHEEGVKSIVTIVSVDETNGFMVLNYTETLTIDRETSLIADRTWGRKYRGSEDPVWFLQAKDGSFQPVLDRSLVDENVRLTWIRNPPAMLKSNRIHKVAKTYVDFTNYGAWREKMKFATNQLVN